MSESISVLLSDRHLDFINQRIADRMYASEDEVIAVAIEGLIEQDSELNAALMHHADEIRIRLETAREDYLNWDEVSTPILRAIANLTKGT